MVRCLCKEAPGITEEYANPANVPANSFTLRGSEASEVTAAVSGGRLHRLVGVSVGLLCVLQAILNISLRLTLSSSDSVTEERDRLERKLNNIDQHSLQGWFYFNHSLYYISSVKKTWKGSREDCQKRGADLVIINSRAEQDLMRQFKKFTWIGLTDSKKEGTWMWVDGTPLTTSYWGPGEPNSSGGNEDCGEIRYHDIRNSWNDQSCDSENIWICEKPAAP